MIGLVADRTHQRQARLENECINPSRARKPRSRKHIKESCMMMILDVARDEARGDVVQIEVWEL